jgi:hypothetical protein
LPRAVTGQCGLRLPTARDSISFSAVVWERGPPCLSAILCARRYIPPTPMMWAALGRLAVPALPDTVVRLDGDVLRADIGRPVQWRVGIRDDTIVSIEHVSDGKIIETLTRGANGVVTYQRPGARRRLELTVLREQPGSFDASIWRL